MNPAIVRCQGITLRYANKTILNEVDLSLPQHAIIGLVGINGSGKSSLMKIIAGVIDYDSGEITKGKSVSLSYIPQDFEPQPNQTIRDYLHDHGLTPEEARLYEERLQNLQKNFVLPNSTTEVSGLSGGQKRQLLLYKSLSLQPDILLLDEPTNHLDLQAILNMQELFRTYEGTILMISHDRYFLDSCVDTIWELDEGTLYTHPGTYSDFLQRKQKRRYDQQQMYLKYKQELRREQAWFNAGVKARGTKDTGRVKRYYELQKLVKDLKPRWKELKLPIPKPQPLGKKILSLKNVSIDFPHKQEPIIHELDFELHPGMRVGLLGPNGSGKTTILKTIIGKHKKSGGKISIGQNTIFNYHDQSRAELNPHHTIHYTISENAINVQFGMRKINIYAYLKKFLFDSNDLTKYVSSLSGGEKARLLLGKILKAGGNFLILDEPTNDLDLDTIQALENTLLEFTGCVMLVSHDRFFLDTICTHIIALEGEGRYTISTGGYTRYIEHYGKEAEFWNGGIEHKRSLVVQKNAPDDSQQFIPAPSKRKTNSKEARQIKAQLRVIETHIKTIEDKITSTQITLSDPTFYTQSPNKIVKVHQNLTLLQEELHKFEIRWLELSEQI